MARAIAVGKDTRILYFKSVKDLPKSRQAFGLDFIAIAIILVSLTIASSAWQGQWQLVKTLGFYTLKV